MVKLKDNWEYVIALAILVLVLILFGLTSCRVKPPQVIHDSIHTTNTVFIPHDTLIHLPPDSSWLVSLIECRKNKPVIVQTIVTGKTGRASVPQIKIDTNGILLAKCVCDSQNIAIRYYEKHTDEFTRIKNTTVVKENYLTGWQWFQLWLGRILLILVVIWIGLKILKVYTKINIPFV